MTFNDTAGGQGLIQDCEMYTGLGDTGISGNTGLMKHFTRLLNNKLHNVVTVILEAQDEWDWDDINKTDYPIATTNLVANQQDYALPASLNLLKIDRVEISYDGITWHRSMPFDINQTDEPTNTTSISNNFSNVTPFYDIRFNSLWLYPIPTANVTAGLKIWYFRQPAEFTTASSTAAVPIDPAFHKMLSIGASLDWAIAKGLPNVEALAAEWNDLEQKLMEHYGSKDKDRRLTFGSIYGTDYGS